MIIPHLQEIKSALNQSPNLLLFCHVDPDGDALGSLLGLGLALKDHGWQVQLISPDGVPANYQFLPGTEYVTTSFTTEGQATAIILDCGDLDRLGTITDKVSSLHSIINIDHHSTNTKFGAINWVEPKASATAEMIFFLLKKLAIPLTVKTATCLYTGIHTDTGGFRYENTTARVHQVAEQLLKIGVKPWKIADEIYDRKSVAQLQLLQKALQRLSVSTDGQIAWISLPYDIVQYYTDEDLSGIINYPRMVASAEVAVLLTESVDGHVRVGLRSRQSVNVGLLAMRLGGGGHPRAAGCILSGTLAHAEKEVLEAVQQALQEAHNRG